MGHCGRIVFFILTMAFFVAMVVSLSSSADKAVELNPPEGTVKTLKDAEYGVLIDCVDIYRQPSLKHPLLKDHVVQLKPSSSFPSYPESREVEGKSKSKRVVYPAGQDWSEDEQCPKGSIPIIRTHKSLGEAAPAAVLDRNHKGVDSLRELRLMYTQLRDSVKKNWNHKGVDSLQELRLMYIQFRNSVQKKKAIPSEI